MTMSLRCDDCGREFDTFDELRRHLYWRDHGNPEGGETA